MKNLSIYFGLFFSLLLTAKAEQGKYSADWDPQFAPLTKQSLSQVIARNPRNAGTLLKMIEKSSASRLGDVAFRSLDALCRKYPKSPDALAAYSWAYIQQIDAAYIPKGDYRGRTKAEEKIYADRFGRVQQLAPKHWLVLFLQGYNAYAKYVNNLEVAFPKLKQAYDLAPNDKYIKAFCLLYNAAARTYAIGGVVDGQKVTRKMEIDLFEKAGKIDPRQSSIWLNLFHRYHYDLKDRAGATRAKRNFLKSLPPKQRAKTQWREVMSQYPD